MTSLWVNTLGWTLLHFLWQGALIALLLALINAALRQASANARYLAACGALLLMVVAAAITFSSLAPAPAGPRAVALIAHPVSIAPAAAHAAAPALEARLEAWLPWIVSAWVVGVLLLSLRSIGGWIAAQRLRRRSIAAADPAWTAIVRRLAHELGISRPVRLSQSLVAEVPAVIGWLRPVILVPAGVFLGLDTRHLEALLAHELAHVRRHDYLVNLFQTMAETLLFYHPAVWWVGQRIRAERENCCDDLALGVCGNVLTYARALTRLEELRSGSRFAMAANGGSLLARIQRLLGTRQAAEARAAKTWLAGALTALAVLALWAGTQMSAAAPAESQTAQPEPRTAPAPKAAPVPAPQPGSYIAGLAAAGYPNLSVDQVIAFKVHGVTPEYIGELRAAGFDHLSPDDLLAFRIHGVDPKRVAEFRTAGYNKITADEMLALQIHGVDPDYARQIKGLGFGDPSLDQLTAMQIHGVAPEYAREIKALGLEKMSLDDLVAFRIHGVDAAGIRGLESLGMGKLNGDQAVTARIHGVTPEFVRGLQSAGLTKLSFDDAVAAAIHGITPAFIEQAKKHGFHNLTLDQLMRLKQAGVFSSDNII